MDISISIALFAIVATLLAQFSASASRTLIDIDRKQSLIDVMDILRMNLDVDGACTKNFAGKSLDPTATVTVEIDGYNGTTDTLTDPILKMGPPYRGVTVTNILLKDQGLLGNATHLADLEIVFASQNSANQLSMTRRLPIVAVLESGVIKNCWLKKKSGHLVFNQACSILTDGSLDSVDSSGQCELAGGQWISGTAQTASCPTGLLPAQASSTYNCRVQLPAGFSDSFPYTPIPMADGSTSALRPSTYRLILDKPSKSCICDWAADLPSSSWAAARCEIYCIIPGP